MNQKMIERNSLIVSTMVNVILTLSGLWIFLTTKIQALFLDFFFSFIAIMSSVTAIIISRVSKKNTKHYPDGIYYLEPLYAIFKSLLILTLITYSVITTGISAYNYFAHGIGEPMNIGPVLPYSVSMGALCFSLFLFNTYQNKRINNVSTLLTVESKTNLIDGLQSLGVGGAVLILKFVDIDSPLGFLYYTGDFFITFLLVVLTIKEPVKVLIASFRELSGGTVSNKVIQDKILQITKKHLNGVVKESTCDIFKVGTKINVRIKISNDIDDLCLLTDVREQILSDLSSDYENVEINFVV